MNMKKIVIALTCIVFVSFALSAVIFYTTGGVTQKSSSKTNNGTIINEEKVAGMDGIDEINVNSSSINVKFIPEDRKDTKIHYHGKISALGHTNPPELQVTTSGSTLYVSLKSTNFTIIAGYVDLDLDIYVPASYSKNIKVDASSASTSIERLKLEKLSCIAHSGRIYIDSVSAKGTTNLEASSGRIEVRGSNFESLVTRTHSGSQKFYNVTGDLDIESSSGGIEVQNANAKNTKVKSSSGSVRLDGVIGNLDGETTSGSFRATYTTFDNNVKIECSSGSCELNLPSSAEFQLNARSSSGSIKCGFDDIQKTSDDDDELIGTVKSDKNKINIRTSSGNIRVN